MSISLLSIGIVIAAAAMVTLLLLGMPFWLALLGYSLAGSAAVLVSAWVFMRSNLFLSMDDSASK